MLTATPPLYRIHIMSFSRLSTLTSALALLAGPALADLTADQVWTDWKDLLSSYGAQISTEGESSSGGSLTVTGLSTIFALPDGSMSLNLGNVVFTEQGDGSVAITLDEVLPFTMDVKAPDGKSGNVGFTLLQPGASMIASGDDTNTRYDFEYPSITLTDLTMTGDDIPEDFPVQLELVMNGTAGFASLTKGDIRNFESTTDVQSLSMSLAFEGATPEEGKGAFALTMADLKQITSGQLGQIRMDMSAAEMIKSGMRQTGTATHGAVTYNINVESPDGGFEMAAAAASGSLDFTMDEGGIDYGTQTRDVTVSIGGSAVPIPPVSLSMAETGGRLAIPLVPSDAPQDFSLVTRMVDLKIDDMLWMMFDPAEALPRDPATLIIDLSGSVVLLQDITSPDYANNPEPEVPGTIESLDVNELKLTIAGAELTGDADFAFNNDMGMPLPSGTANLMLVGGNALLDRLVGMGLVPEDQAMGARMMLGMFARPGDGEDTLVSTIEVNEDGSVLANGQRIK
jgi:Uncharacterized protein conserved in bacteria (DUF2125)